MGTIQRYGYEKRFGTVFFGRQHQRHPRSNSRKNDGTHRGDSGVWKVPLWRSQLRPGNFRSHDDSGGTRLSSTRNSQRSFGKKQWANYSSQLIALLLLVVIKVLSGCHSPSHQDPSTVFQDIHKDFLLGNLTIAQQEAGIAREKF